jgi:hypothetical protein
MHEYSTLLKMVKDSSGENLKQYALNYFSILSTKMEKMNEILGQKNVFVGHQTRDIFYQLTVTFFHFTSIKVDSEKEEVRVEGIQKLETLLRNTLENPSVFVEAPVEAIVKCALALSAGYLKSKKSKEAAYYVKKAFALAKAKQMYPLIYHCLDLFIIAALEVGDPNPMEAIQSGQKILVALEEMGDENGCHLLLPTLLKLHSLCQKFLPQESVNYLDRAASLVKKYGKNKFDDKIIEDLQRLVDVQKKEKEQAESVC